MTSARQRHPHRPAGEGILPAPSMRALGRAQLRELIARARRPGVISFAVGLPAEEAFPSAAMAEAAAAAAAEPAGLQYGLPCARLARQIVDLMAKRGVACTPEEVFLTSGAQQGMDLITRLLVEAGGRAMVEDTIYEGILLALRSRGARIDTVRSDPERGLDLDHLEDRLARGPRPAYLFVIPDGHNPLGVDLAPAARARLIDLAHRYGVPLVEDDAYGHLRYDRHDGEGGNEIGGAPRPLRALDGRWTIHLGTFSKIVAPALRVGWIVAPAPLMPLLSALKHGSDLDSATFAQRTLSRLLETFDLERHCAALRRLYRERRDALLAALERHCADVARWQRPSTGFYVWLELRPRIDAGRLLEAAISWEDVAFSPGAAFAAGKTRAAASSLRLSFAGLTPAELEEGVVRLRRAIARFH